MADPVVVAGVQLPVDGAGKLTGAVIATIDGQTIYLPATVLVDGKGNEIGSQLLAAVSQLAELGSELRRARLALELLVDETVDDDRADGESR